MLIAVNTIQFSERIDDKGRTIPRSNVGRGERFEAPNEATRKRLIEDGVAIDERNPDARLTLKRIEERLAAENMMAQKNPGQWDHWWHTVRR